MTVGFLKQLLNTYPDDMDLFIQTTPEDYCQPLTLKQFSMIKASVDKQSGCLEQAKLLLTAFHPEKKAA